MLQRKCVKLTPIVLMNGANHQDKDISPQEIQTTTPAGKPKKKVGRKPKNTQPQASSLTPQVLQTDPKIRATQSEEPGINTERGEVRTQDHNKLQVLEAKVETIIAELNVELTRLNHENGALNSKINESMSQQGQSYHLILSKLENSEDKLNNLSEEFENVKTDEVLFEAKAKENLDNMIKDNTQFIENVNHILSLLENMTKRVETLEEKLSQQRGSASPGGQYSCILDNDDQQQAPASMQIESMANNLSNISSNSIPNTISSNLTFSKPNTNPTSPKPTPQSIPHPTRSPIAQTTVRNSFAARRYEDNKPIIIPWGNQTLYPSHREIWDSKGDVHVLFGQISSKPGKVGPSTLQDYISISWKGKILRPTLEELREGLGNLFVLDSMLNPGDVQSGSRSRASSTPANNLKPQNPILNPQAYFQKAVLNSNRKLRDLQEKLNLSDRDPAGSLGSK